MSAWGAGTAHIPTPPSLCDASDDSEKEVFLRGEHPQRSLGGASQASTQRLAAREAFIGQRTVRSQRAQSENCRMNAARAARRAAAEVPTTAETEEAVDTGEQAETERARLRREQRAMLDSEEDDEAEYTHSQRRAGKRRLRAAIVESDDGDEDIAEGTVDDVLMADVEGDEGDLPAPRRSSRRLQVRRDERQPERDAAAAGAAAAAAEAQESVGDRACRWGVWQEAGESDDAFAKRVKTFGKTLGAAAGRGEVERYDDLLRPGTGNCLLPQQPAPSVNLEHLGGPVPEEALRAEHAAAVARQELRLEYAFQQFDIERLSLRYCECDVCGRAVVLGGVVTQVGEVAQNAQMLFAHSSTKRQQPYHVTSSGKYEMRKKGTEQRGCEPINTWCKQCDAAIKAKELPPFSEVNFNHGIQLPPELSGLTYAEQQCCSEVAC